MGWCGSIVINGANGNCLTNQGRDQFCKTSEPGIHKNNQTGDEGKEGFMNSPLQPPIPTLNPPSLLINL